MSLPFGRPLSEALVRRDWSHLDPRASELLSHLRRTPAALVWHKCGTFEEHLIGVWAILSAWQQPVHCARLGLFHSAYGNSFVAMRIFDIATDREALAGLIGDRAEDLVFKFCSVDRQSLEDTVLKEGAIRPEGYDLADIRIGKAMHISQADAVEMIVETVADFMEQSTGWQSELEAGSGGRTLWPGSMKPTLRMAKCSRFVSALLSSGCLEGRELPVFDGGRTVLCAAEEEEARDLYWSVVSPREGHPPQSIVEQEMALARASALNPFVGEPHVLRAQLLISRGAFAEARSAAVAGLAALELLATAWDKRMPWSAWVNWARVLGLQASTKQWPKKHGGLESLGATHPSMQFRELNDTRNVIVAKQVVRGESSRL